MQRCGEPNPCHITVRPLNFGLHPHKAAKGQFDLLPWMQIKVSASQPAAIGGHLRNINANGRLPRAVQDSE